MARDEPQVNLRMPLSLKERLEAEAATNKRSLTAEIVARLDSSFEQQESDRTALKRERRSREILMQVIERTDRMQSLAEHMVAWRQKSIALFQRLMDAAGDRVSMDMVREWDEWRQLPVEQYPREIRDIDQETRQSLSESSRPDDE